MNFTLKAQGPGGHTEASFEKDEIRISFVKTDPNERGMISGLVEKATADGMKIHVAGKKGALKELADAGLLEEIMKGKAELVLKGSADVVKKLAVLCMDKEVEKGKVVLIAQEDNTWKRVLGKGELKETEEKKKVATSTEVVRAG
jgi:hypothetical protein